MRILHIGILAEVLSTLRCNECNDTLYHCIRCIVKQTFFRVKCQRCHSEHATFPFSRSLDTPSHHTCVNVTFNDMNETTMRSALATHFLPLSYLSTVILLNRGTTPEKLSRALRVLLDHAAGIHYGCPTGENSWCQWNRLSISTTPATLTTFTTVDIQKVQESFNTYATTEFCSHLTLGLTQNENESHHNMIWCLCSKNKYVSPIYQDKHCRRCSNLQRGGTIALWYNV